VFAPIGAAATLHGQVDELVRTGRQKVDQQVVLARFVGKLAVQQGRVELRKRIDARRAPVTSAPAVREPEPAPEPVPPPATAPDAATVAPSMLAIADFDSLAANQVIDRLGALSMDELDLVERYERAHRRRRTVLGRIAQLRAAE
jgi:hypothetical protein